jgi:hypothetical protein
MRVTQGLLVFIFSLRAVSRNAVSIRRLRLPAVADQISGLCPSFQDVGRGVRFALVPVALESSSIDPSDYRTKRMPLKYGTGPTPVLGFGALSPDAAATISATRGALEAGFRHPRMCGTIPP